MNVTIGLNATFTCKATGFGLTFSWKVPFSLTNNNGIVIGDNTSELSVVNVTKHANGEYTCNVTDFIGQEDIAMAELIVVGEFINYCTLYVHYSYCRAFKKPISMYICHLKFIYIIVDFNK